ncbi:MAG: hypothetical protein QF704_18000, partial [Anaerolineales bacterium]|nr:hypothetical protein [Anaerolineales bacterium]
MKKLITCLTVSTLSGAAFATTWTVDDDGKADFDNIQAAVDAASDGDEIVVMPGTYTSTGDEVVNIYGKSLLLRSFEGAENTIIDGEILRAGIRLSDYNVNNFSVYGFTIQNCLLIGDEFQMGLGAAIHTGNFKVVDISNCVFNNNSTSGNNSEGGAIYVGAHNNCVITNCQF